MPRQQALHALCLKYDPSFDHQDLTQVKLSQAMVDGTTRKRSVPQFSGKYGVEALLHVELAFCSAATHLLWNTADEFFDHFPECFSEQAEEQWRNIMAAVPAGALMNMARFDQCLREMYLYYVGADARDVLYEHIKTWYKPYSKSVRDHATRMETVIRYAAMLPGTAIVWNDNEKKKCIFSTYPIKWQQSLCRVHRSTDHVTLREIIEFMADEQGYADGGNSNSSDGNRKKRGNHGGNGNDGAKRLRGGGGNNSNNSNNSGRGRGRRNGKKNGGGNTNNRSDVAKPDPNKPCPIPWHYGSHTWRECYDNKDGPNYRPDRRNNQGGGGRGREEGRQGGGGGRTGGQYYYHHQPHYNEHYHGEYERQERGEPRHEHYYQQAPSRDGSRASRDGGRGWHDEWRAYPAGRRE